MRGLSKLDVDKVRHFVLAMEVLDKLQCLYGGDSHIAQEEEEEPCCSSNKLEHGEVDGHHSRIDEEDALEEIPCFSEASTSGSDKY